MASVAEADISDIFHNYQTSVPLRIPLQERDHLQPPTTIRTDNTNSVDLANSITKLKHNTAMDKNFYWIKYRIS